MTYNYYVVQSNVLLSFILHLTAYPVKMFHVERS